MDIGVEVRFSHSSVSSLSVGFMLWVQNYTAAFSASAWSTKTHDAGLAVAVGVCAVHTHFCAAVSWAFAPKAITAKAVADHPILALKWWGGVGDVSESWRAIE